MEEAESDVSLRVEQAAGCVATIKGRGDLHLAILIEKMRREGFEMSVTPPEIITRSEEGRQLEPIERVSVQVAGEYMNLVMEKMTARKAVYLECEDVEGESKLVFSVPTRGLIGLRSEILNETKGTAVITQQFVGYEEHRGALSKNNKGALVSTVAGQCNDYALQDLQKFGALFVRAGTEVYPGMVIGENKLGNDMEVNPVRAKKLTNVRTHAADAKIVVFPPKELSLDQMIGYIRDDELIEVTPGALRMRKRHLDASERKRQRRLE